jgi:acetyl-CoA acetyltransferase
MESVKGHKVAKSGITDVAVIACAEAKNVVASGRSVPHLAGEVFSGALQMAGIDKDEIDGFVVCGSLTEAGNPFWSAVIADHLGLELDWCEGVDLGGASYVGAVARAALAISSGMCSTVLVLAADAPSTRNQQDFKAYRPEWQEPVGLMGPPGLFGLLSSVYDSKYGLDPEALAKLAVTQRQHALMNELACERLRKPLETADYLNSRIISDPIKLLDCVMVCDGANAIILTSVERARNSGDRPIVRLAGYGEKTNHKITDPLPDITETGHQIAGKRAFEMAGVTPKDIKLFNPYDDFLIAVMLQMEQLGFCKPGQGADFIHSTDLSYKGDLPLNTGGGQISAGQAGLAGGGHNFVEAARQMFGEAGERQIENPAFGVVTGIGTIPYARNWSVSNVMILERSA